MVGGGDDLFSQFPVGSIIIPVADDTEDNPEPLPGSSREATAKPQGKSII